MSSTTTLLLYPPNTTPSSSTSTSTSKLHFLSPHPSKTRRISPVSCSLKPQNASFCCALKDKKWVPALLGAGVVSLALVGPSIAAELPLLGELNEPSNALSLPTWTVHVSSVVEWFYLNDGTFWFMWTFVLRIIAMALVWQYGDKPGNEAWKGLSWGMVPLLGGAMCACTWHFFYNAESLEVLVALQAALTLVGNATMCVAAFRIYKSHSRSENV